MAPKFEYVPRNYPLRREILELFKGRKITTSEMILLVVVDSSADPDEGGCFATDNDLAGLFGVSSRCVKVWLTRLKKLGLITSHRSGVNRCLVTPFNRFSVGADKGTVFPLSGGFSRVIREIQFPYHPTEKPLAEGDVANGPVPSRHKGNYCSLMEHSQEEGKGGEGMGFLTGTNSPSPRKRPTADDESNAEILHGFIVGTRRNYKRWSKKSWANEFRMLREAYATAHNLTYQEAIRDLTIVLEWYTSHFEDRTTPKAYAAASFREKFNRIEAAYKHWLERNPQVTPSPEALKISKMVNVAAWPKGGNSSIDIVVEVSLCNYRKFLKAYNTVYDFYSTEPVSQLRHYVMVEAGNSLSDEINYLVRWFQMVYKKVKDWKDWDGDLFKYVWRKDHKLFENSLYGNGVDRQHYLKFMEMVDGNIKS